MRAFWARLAVRLHAMWGALAIAGTALVAALLYLVTRRALAHHAADVVSSDLGPALDAADRRVSAANAAAAIAVRAADAKTDEINQRVVAITQDPDAHRRRDRLIELATELEGPTVNGAKR